MRGALLVDDDEQAETVDPSRQRFGLALWALLFFNGMAFAVQSLIIPIPLSLGKLLTQGALALVAFLVLIFNRDKLIRPNLFLSLYSLLALLALGSSLRMNAGLGSLFRAGRFLTFVGVLWLLTPLWGRRDRILLRFHVQCLTVIVGMIAVGGLITPGKAREINGRLAGVIWPIPPTQVGHYAAVLAGILVVLLISKAARARAAIPVIAVSVAVLMLSQTRTAVIGLLGGIIASTFILLTVRRRARHVAIGVAIALVLLGTAFAPVVQTWFARGQSKELVGNFNGRKEVWDALLHTPRPQLETFFGHGLTNKSFDGLPIDNSWLATYFDEGLVGVLICAAILISLLMLAATRPRGPALAVAIFIIVYCTIASTTETGLGDVSPYLLDLTVAAALLAPSFTTATDRRRSAHATMQPAATASSLAAST